MRRLLYTHVLVQIHTPRADSKSLPCVTPYSHTMLNCSRRLANFASSSSRQLEKLGGASTRLYHQNVIDHYEKPRNVGSFSKLDNSVGTGLVGAPACGDVMKLQIRVDEQGNITESCFKTFGCGSAIASSSVATEWVKGKSIDEVLTIKNSDIAKHLSLPPVKLHCSMLAEDAIKAAVKDVQAKRAKLAASKSQSNLHDVEQPAGEEKLAAAVGS